MDFIFHGATNVAVQKTIEQKKEIKKPRWQGWWYAFLWGAISDLIPFTIPVMYSIFSGIAFWTGENPEMLAMSQHLYQYTHSLVIFLALFFACTSNIQNLALAHAWVGASYCDGYATSCSRLFSNTFSFPTFFMDASVWNLMGNMVDLGKSLDSSHYLVCLA